MPIDPNEPVDLPGPPDQTNKTLWRRGERARPSIEIARPYDPRPLMGALAARTTQDRYRFAVFGDTHHSPAFATIAQMLPALGVDFAVTVGDLVDLGGGREGPVHYGKLAAEADRLLRSMPVWAAIGNHDADSRWERDVWNGWANFRAFFNLPPWYRFDFRNATFLVLSWMLPDEEELAWLKEQLAARTSRHVFVVGHYPLHRIMGVVGQAETERPVERELRRLLSDHGVAAHFSGHAHVYYRTRRDGVTYLTSGCAGVKTAEVTFPEGTQADDAWFGRRDGRYVLRADGRDRHFESMPNAFVVIDVDGPRITGRTISTTGETWDSFSIREPVSP